MTLRNLLAELPAEALLPAGWLREQLEADTGDARGTAAAGAVLTVGELAVHLRRSASTVRGWLEAGLFPGAYHLPASGKLSKRGRPKVGAWRVPAAAVEVFSAAQREVPTIPPRPITARVTTRGARIHDDTSADLGAWRHQRRKATDA